MEDAVREQPADHSALEAAGGDARRRARLDLDASEEADPRSHLEHELVRLEWTEDPFQDGLELAYAGDELLPLEDVEVRHGGSADARVTRVGQAVSEDQLAAVLPERAPDALGDHDPTEREVARGDPLRHHHHVGVEPVASGREPFTGATEAADDLVRDEQDVVLAAQRLNRLEVARGGVDDSAGADDRLGHERRDRVRAVLFDERREGRCVVGGDPDGVR